MKYELVIVWDSETTEIIEYNNEREAHQGLKNIYLAFGYNQVWCCVRSKHDK